MPLQYRLSDAVNITSDTEAGSIPVIELEFKFVRYRLVLDDMGKANELLALLKELTLPPKKVKGEEQRMPKFYKKQEGDA